MARYYNVESRKLKPALRKHVESFGGIYNYKTWCEQHGFASHVEKSASDIAGETAFRQDLDAQLSVQVRLHKNPRKVLEEICLGQMHSSTISRPDWKAFAAQVEACKLKLDQRKSLLALCLHLFRNGDFLLNSTVIGGSHISFLTGVINLHAHRSHWIRKLEDWRATTHNPDRQFASLLRHLFVRFDIPRFLEKAWFDQSEAGSQHRNWFVHVGAGGNMRTAVTPVPLTRLMAHHMMLAPGDTRVSDAIIWGQVFALGGDRRLAEALLPTRMAADFANNAFWLSVIAFFVENPLLDRNQVGPIIDYLHHQKFEPRNLLGENNQIVALPPVQPNLCMRGRTVDALMAQVEEWHRDLSRDTKSAGEIFKPSGFQGFRLEVGEVGHWRILELRSSALLREEGRRMKHCVYSYTRSCVSGDNSIWTMEFVSADGIEKRQTIQVTRNGQIVQCRGKNNRLPSPAEYNVVCRWARSAQLTLATHVKPDS